jgi:hypothetical protein
MVSHPSLIYQRKTQLINQCFRGESLGLDFVAVEALEFGMVLAEAQIEVWSLVY